MASGKVNAVLSGLFYKSNPNWNFQNINAFGPQKTFTECNDMIMTNLEKVGFDPIILQETQNWNKESGKVFNLNKEQVINIPKTLTSFTIGLGWTTECDIDASVLLLNKDGRL